MVPRLVGGTDPKIQHLIAIHFENHGFHNYFGFGLVHVVQNLLRDGYFIRSIAKNNGVHRRDLGDVTHVEDRAQGGDGFGNFRCGDGV